MKAENLVRHIDSNHPRHPEAAKIKDSLRSEERYAPRKVRAPIRIRRIHVGVILGVVLVVAGAYAAAPYFDPYARFTRDSCIASESFHIHQYLRITIEGAWYPIPTDIGISASCTRPLHTHTASDPSTGFVQLHVEGPIAKDFPLGDFFAVWGQPFTPTRILDCNADGTNVVHMTVGVWGGGAGSPSNEYGALVLRDQQQIEIFCGPAS